ncbi:MAG TPA: hypothetical protein VMP86_08225 [Candidatus Binatia bacterium]|nr:hypothetical protein [Candidatus Binatia bacterium]
MSDRRALLARLAPLLLIGVLSVALLPDTGTGLRLPSADILPASEMRAALDRLDEDATVLVGFDPDLGTYAEIRPTVRALVADLLGRGATLAFVSLTPEGRALAIAELGRLERLAVGPGAVVDLGFLPGAEAALVRLARGIGPVPADALVAGLPRETTLSGAAMAVVVGGNDLGARSWVEQVAPRADDLEIVAVAPTVLLPELQPYIASGQLAALLATPRDGAAYRESLDLGALDPVTDPRPGAPPLAILVGVLVAIGVLGEAVGARAAGALRAQRTREVT